MRALMTTLALLTVATATEATAGSMMFKFVGEVFHADTASNKLFGIGTTLSGEFAVNPANFTTAGVHTFNGVTSYIFADGLFNHPLYNGFVIASDNHSLIEPEESIDELIIVLAIASADRPIT